MNYPLRSPRPRLIPQYLNAPTMSPRDYQSKMVADIRSHQQQGHKRIFAYGPPGSGKTSIMASIARAEYAAGRKTTILVPMNRVVTKTADPTRLNQMCGALVSMGLAGHFGVVCGAFPSLRNDAAPIQVVTLQSLKAELHILLADTNTILIDEGHTGAFFREAENAYKLWQWSLVVNFSATPYNRSMGKDEAHGELQRNTALVSAPSYRALEKRGYLAPLRYHGNEQKQNIDLGSDTAIKWMLERWVSQCAELSIPTTHAVGFTQSRRKGRSQAESIQRIGASLGLKFTIVGDECSQEEYELADAEFEAGLTNLLCVQALTTGWDSPKCRHALFFRTIPSRDRCIQAATRADRVEKPDPKYPRHIPKKYGEIWDFAGNFQLTGEDSGLHPKVEDLSESVNVSVLATKSKGEGEAPMKKCIKCKESIYASAIECPHCHAIQPTKTALYVDAKGKLVSFIPEAHARENRAGLKAYFRQWRKYGFTLGWSPFAAHKKCADLKLAVAMDDVDFWKGSVGVTRESYQRYLDSNARSWGWDESKKAREMIREFGP